MKKLYTRVFIITLFIFSTSKAFSTDSTRVYPETRNCFRGTIFFTRATLAYEHAVKPNFSMGIKYSMYWGRFPGISGGLYGRLYAKSFHQSGFFGELEAMYGHYTPYVYSTYSNYSYYGKHRANLNYYAGTLSAGYKVHGRSNVFWEFMAGVRYGYLTKGANDNYMHHDTDLLTSDSVTEHFLWGPGFPIVIKIFMGIDF